MNSGNAQLAQAYTFQQQGRLAEAAAAYRQVLTREPRNAAALHLLGVTMARMGRAAEAVDLIGAAIRIQPSNPAMQTNLGNALAEIERFAEAVKCYDRAVALKPDLAPAYRGRGVALLRLERFEDALSSLTRAVRLAPDDAQAHNDLGVSLERIGRSEEALGHFERALAINPYHVEAHHNRGLVQLSLGRFAEALSSLDQALGLQPRHAAILSNRGNVLRALGRSAEALGSYDHSLAIAPGDATTLHNRGIALLDLERYADALASFDRALELAIGNAATYVQRGKACVQLDRPLEALANFERALAIAPDDFDAHFNLGLALALLGRYEESLASFDRTLGLDPDSAQALNNRGVALGRLSRPGEALESFARALAREPDYVEAHTNVGNTQKGLKRYREALDSFDRALSIDSDHPMTLWSKALLELTLGEFQDGWPLYESRFRLPHLRSLQRSFDAPRWSGAAALEGKTILIHAEQGLGDTVQFSRYIRLLEERGARVVFAVQPVLKKLLDTLGMRGTLVSSVEPVPPFDFHCPLLSLPLAFATHFDSIPGGVPYLQADAAIVRSWHERLAALPGLRIGLNWQGTLEAEKQPWIQGRSFALAMAEPLARLAGVSLVSLQKGSAAEQRNQVEFGPSLVQLTDPTDEGEDAILATAALMMGLDLVITSDTFVAHLAGALGIPVWVVLHAVPDWRWLTERCDSPWYPSMRLFRQREPGDWSEVFERVATEVAGLRDLRCN